MTTIIVIAKETVAGHVKTRLHPPLTLEQAAEVAAASLDDTLRAVRRLPFDRRVLAFDGEAVPPGAVGFDVIPQVDGDLDARLAAAFGECTGPTVLIGMDTPQVDSRLLTPLAAPWETDADALLGRATDGGFWALGLAEPDGDLIRGVPMSRADTGARQRARLDDAGLRVRDLPVLTDVDTWSDALEVARVAPRGRFGRLVAAYDRALEVDRIA